MAGQRLLSKEAVVTGTPEDIWPMWTSAEGLIWISSRSRIDPVPGGDYAWFLDLEPDERGVRGSDGSTIVSLDPPRELVFDWTFPPETPGLRASGATTRVVLTLEPVSNGQTRVTLTKTGWGEGEEWDRGYEYFDNAWGYVLERLRSVTSD